MRKAAVHRLLNIEPNPFQDINTFKRNLIIDLLLDGNIFIYLMESIFTTCQQTRW
jgi:phage portal protein BeeE